MATCGTTAGSIHSLIQASGEFIYTQQYTRDKLATHFFGGVKTTEREISTLEQVGGVIHDFVRRRGSGRIAAGVARVDGQFAGGAQGAKGRCIGEDDEESRLGGDGEFERVVSG